MAQSINSSTGQLQGELFKHQKDNMPTVAQSRSHKHAVGTVAAGGAASSSTGIRPVASHDLNQSLMQLQRQRDQQTAQLQQEMTNCATRQQELLRHRENLLQQLKLCEQEMHVNAERLSEAETKLGETEKDFQQRAQQLIEQSESLQKDQQIQQQVTTLLDGVRNFEYKFADALFCRQQHLQRQLQLQIEEIKRKQLASSPAPVTATAAQGAQANSNTTVITATSAGMRMQRDGVVATSLTADGQQTVGMALKSYIETEAQCISLLAGRVQTAQGKLAAMQKELQVYQAVGMKVTLLPLSLSLVFLFLVM